jgi:hypothetical protein
MGRDARMPWAQEALERPTWRNLPLKLVRTLSHS